MTTLLVVLIIACVCVVLAGWLATARLKSRQHYREHRDGFFRLAKQVIRHPSCPWPVAGALHSLGADMNKLSTFWGVLMAAVHPTEPRGENPVDRALCEAPPELRALFRQAVTEGLLAISHRSPLWGSVIRKALNGKKKGDGASRTVIRRVVRQSQRHHSQDHFADVSTWKVA